MAEASCAHVQYHSYEAAAIAGGAGELSNPLVMVTSPLSPPLLLRSLGITLLPFISLEPVLSLFTSPAKLESLDGAPQVDIPHNVPVKDLI